MIQSNNDYSENTFKLITKSSQIKEHDAEQNVKVVTDVCDEMSLHSLLCNESEEPSLDSFAYNKNDSFFKSLKTIEILPSLASILSDFNELTIHASSRTQSCHVWGNTGRAHFKPSLFFKSLSANVKIDKYKLLKLKQVRKDLKLHEPHSWYSINLLVSLAIHDYFC